MVRMVDMKNNAFKVGISFTVFFNVILIVFIILFIKNGFSTDVINDLEFKNYMESKGCELIDLQAEEEYEGTEIFLISNVESCPYLVSYTTFSDDYVRDDFFRQMSDDVLKNNADVNKTDKIRLNLFSKFSLDVSEGAYYKIAVLNKNSVLYASGDFAYYGEINNLFDNFGYLYTPNLTYILSGLGIFVLIYVFYAFCLWGIFKKTKRNKKLALIPIYNIVCLVKDVLGNGLYSLLYIVPFVNIIFHFILLFKLGKRFNKDLGYSIGLMILTTIFLPLLAYDKSKCSKNSNLRSKPIGASKEDKKGYVFKWVLTVCLLFISLLFWFIYLKDLKLTSYLVSAIMFMIYAGLSCPFITNYTARFKRYTYFKSFMIMVLAFIHLILVCALPG